MLKLLKLALPVLVLGIINLSCVKGCIDGNAINYDPVATANNGCIYPENVSITSIRLSSHPTEDLFGNDWDTSSAPDKFFKIIDDYTGEVLYTTAVEEFLPTSWTIVPNIAVNAYEVILRFELYDQDDLEDVFMDRATLVLRDLIGTSASTNNDFYPETGTLIGEQNSSITLTMSWTE